MLPPSTAVDAGVAAAVACEMVVPPGAGVTGTAVGVLVLLLQAVATRAATVSKDAKRFISTPLLVFADQETDVDRPPRREGFPSWLLNAASWA
jgi:hypothetical protein